MYFCYFIIISHWKKDWPFIWNKLEFSLLKNAFCQVWLKLAQWLWRTRLLKLNFVNVWSLFCYYLPLHDWNIVDTAYNFIHSINQYYLPLGKATFELSWMSFTQECLVPSLVSQYIFATPLLSRIGKGSGPSFEET